MMLIPRVSYDALAAAHEPAINVEPAGWSHLGPRRFDHPHGRILLRQRGTTFAGRDSKFFPCATLLRLLYSARRARRKTAFLRGNKLFNCLS
jgi:hypothetical protein